MRKFPKHTPMIVLKAYDAVTIRVCRVVGHRFETEDECRGFEPICHRCGTFRFAVELGVA